MAATRPTNIRIMEPLPERALSGLRQIPKTPYPPRILNAQANPESAMLGPFEPPEWPVESIQRSKMKRDGLHYLVQWEGSDPTWEPARNLTNCDLLLARFHYQRPKARGWRWASRKVSPSKKIGRSVFRECLEGDQAHPQPPASAMMAPRPGQPVYTYTTAGHNRNAQAGIDTSNIEGTSQATNRAATIGHTINTTVGHTDNAKPTQCPPVGFQAWLWGRHPAGHTKSSVASDASICAPVVESVPPSTRRIHLKRQASHSVEQGSRASKRRGTRKTDGGFGGFGDSGKEA